MRVRVGMTGQQRGRVSDSESKVLVLVRVVVRMPVGVPVDVLVRQRVRVQVEVRVVPLPSSNFSVLCTGFACKGTDAAVVAVPAAGKAAEAVWELRVGEAEA